MKFLKTTFLFLWVLAATLLSAVAAASGAWAGGLVGTDGGWELIMPMAIGLLGGMILAFGGWTWAVNRKARYGSVVAVILVVPPAITFFGFWVFYLLCR